MANAAQTIGLLGLGLVGRAITPLLMAGGHSVVGYAPSQGSRDALADLGGTPAGSVAEVAARCATVVLAVFDTAQAEAVIEGPGGILSVAAPGGAPRRIINTSTCDPERMEALAARVAGRAALVEMPISGTSTQIARAEGVGLVGGTEAEIEAVDDVLALICPRRFALGPVGAGGKAKLAVNLVLGLNRAALAEGIAFAEALGLEAGAFLNVARGSAAYSQVMDVKGAKMVERDYAPLSKVSQTTKDFKMMRAAAAAVGQSLPFAEVYVGLMEELIAAGEGEIDNAALLEAIKRRTAPAA